MQRRLVTLLSMLGLLAAGCTATSPPTESTPPASPSASGTPSAIAKLKVGDCTGKVDLTGASMTEVPTVPCTGAHNWEVHAVVPVASETFPGGSALSEQALKACAASYVDYVGVQSEYSRYSSAYLSSDVNAWKVPENRVITCLVGSADNVLTRSAKNDPLIFPSKGQCTGRQDIAGKPLQIIDCAKKHYYEVYADKQITSKKAPSAAEERKLYSSVCAAGFKKFVGVDPDKSKYEIGYFIAGKDIWSKVADHRIVCSVGSPKGGIKGSLKGEKK